VRLPASVVRSRTSAFSDADVRLLTTLAGSLSVALENARLFEEIRQRNSELSLISDVRRGLAERLEMTAMFDVMGDRFQEIFDAQVVDIGIVDADAGRMSFPYTIERGVRMVHEPIEVMGFRKVALETHEPVVINKDIETASADVGQPTVLAGEPPKSSVFVPLLVGPGPLVDPLPRLPHRDVHIPIKNPIWFLKFSHPELLIAVLFIGRAIARPHFEIRCNKRLHD